MEKITSTPFNEYREEQSGIKLIDYFVRPEIFDQLSDNKPKLIYGSRGTGKTTLLKAMSIEQAEDKREYLEKNNYIGIYYRTDLNVSSAFYEQDLPENEWSKLYSYYFVCCIVRDILIRIDYIKEIAQADEKAICQEVSLFFEFGDCISFQDIILKVRNEIVCMEKYINNLSYVRRPFIGAFAKMLGDIPQIVFDNCNAEIMKGKHFIYLIDEFESLYPYQQKAILSLVKYADQKHTYIIGLRPFGLKALSTVGDEYIRETDDYKTFILDDDRTNYLDFARRVCNKRLELFYKKYYPAVKDFPTIDAFLNPGEDVDEIKLIFKNENCQQIHAERVRTFLKAFEIEEDKICKYFIENQEQFYFVVLKLIKGKNSKRSITTSLIKKELEAFRNPDKSHKDFIHNYRVALIYYLNDLYGKKKYYYGMHTVVNLSGHTLRYLLEMCNEIFLHAYRADSSIYEKPHELPIQVQSDEIRNVSARRFEQIRAVPDTGLKMRQFINVLGQLAFVQHEDSRLSIWEPNHFSIQPDSEMHEDITDFLTECVFRGVLIQYEDNKIKVKNSIGYDQNIYQIHPIYTPKFQISSRRKQKLIFTVEEISLMIGNDVRKINNLIRKHEKEILSSKIDDIIYYLKYGKKNENSQETLLDYIIQGE